MGKVETFTFGELFEVSDANFDCLIGKTPIIIVGTSIRAGDYQYSDWVMSREDGKPIFGQLRHWFDHRKIDDNPEAYFALPKEAHQKAVLGYVDNLFMHSKAGREKLDVRVAKDLAEMNKMVIALWPHTNFAELYQAHLDRIQKMEAAAVKNKDGTCRKRRRRDTPVRPRLETLVQLGAGSEASLKWFDAHVALSNMPTGAMQ